jgi:hypothetical protein
MQAQHAMHESLKAEIGIGAPIALSLPAVVAQLDTGTTKVIQSQRRQPSQIGRSKTIRNMEINSPTDYLR